MLREKVYQRGAEGGREGARLKRPGEKLFQTCEGLGWTGTRFFGRRSEGIQGGRPLVSHGGGVPPVGIRGQR